MILKRVIFTVAVLAFLMMPLTANGASSTANWVVANTITINAADWLDLTDTAPVEPHHYVISGITNYATLYGYVIAGRNGGTWDGVGGIRSTIVAADAAKRGLAVMTGTDYRTMYPVATFHGKDVLTSAALIQYTYLGDSNLSGTVDTTDLLKVKNAVIAQNNSPGAPGYDDWAAGDTNYSATVDTTDLLFVKNSVIGQNNSTNYPVIETGMPLVAGAGGAMVVPEPSTFVLVFLAMACFFGFRKFFK